MQKDIPHKICAKLKSKSGASLILVLVLFFLCVMVSSVVVAVAATGAGRSANRERQQQGYLSITSAVQLVIEEIESSGKFVGSEEMTDYGCNASGEKVYSTIYYDEVMDVAETPVHEDITAGSGVDIWNVDVANTDLHGAFRLLLLKACTAIYDDMQNDFSSSFTISAADSRLADVYCDFYMDEEYNITMKFTAADTEYAMTLEFSGNTSKTTESVEVSCNHKVFYIELLPDGSMEEDTVDDRTLEGKKTIRRTTVTWVLPTVSKGGD